MHIKRMVIVIALLGFLVTTLASPKPARASSVTTALIIAGVVTGAYVAAIFIATAIHRQSRGPLLMPTDVGPPSKQDEHGLKFGPRCAQQADAPTVLCW